jgi:methionine-rich copper-binding protein CopC
VDRRDSRVDRANPALLRATLPPLPPGTYKVQWRVLSIDADVTEGSSSPSSRSWQRSSFSPP